jgi:hypothetical protein
MLGAMTFAHRRYRNARLASIAMVLSAVVLGASSCEGDEDGPKQQDPRANDRASVTETDVIQCGMSGTLLDNRTQGAYNVHVRVKNDCSAMIDDTLRPPADDAHLKVVDAQNRVVNGQDIVIPSRTTWRGTVTVPTLSRIVLECGRRAQFIVNNGCSWSYTYSP